MRARAKRLPPKISFRSMMRECWFGDEQLFAEQQHHLKPKSLSKNKTQ
jgi:hypothetical protein